jgi:putative flippase GtrA
VIRALVRLRQRLTRYTAGSVIAGVISEVAFLAVYGSGLAGPRVASVVAFLAGAVPNYHLNRSWTWGRRGRSDPLRELLPYAATVLVSVGIASLTTSFVDRSVGAWTDNRLLQVVLVTATFAATYGGLFVAKFVLFERVLFADRRRTRSSPAR